ncbi:MAG: glycosyltransferase [Candidatus Hodarchaeales archaeon]|jgi:glycosyltransferase involved in cell wall biosynthesis
MKASIIIINYNDKTRVQRAIQSALDQTYKDKEVIVVDDGSDSETRAIYKQFDGIRIIQRERTNKHARTVPQALNAGIEASKGEYICVLGSDNYYDKTFLEECLKNDNDIMYVNWKIFGLTDYECNIEEVWQTNDIVYDYLMNTHLDHQCMLVKRDIQMKAGLYDERFPRSQDCDMIIRLMNTTKDWKHVPKRLFFFEQHEADQQKPLASLYYKTLWTLRHNLKFTHLFEKIKAHPELVFLFRKAINDFCTQSTWQKDFRDSKYYKLIEQINKQIEDEIRED